MRRFYQYGAFGSNLSRYDQVDQLFRHRRATVSLVNIGLYEVATVFYGPIGNTIQELTVTIDIIKDMKARVEEWSDQYDYTSLSIRHRQKAWQTASDKPR